jgi:hypothetical protein
MPGMLGVIGPSSYRASVVEGCKVGGVQDDDWHPKAWGLEAWSGIEPWTSADMVPDLRDPATLGCLIALVREAWYVAYTRNVNGPGPRAWECACNDGDGWVSFWGSTEAAVLVSALEASGDNR